MTGWLCYCRQPHASRRQGVAAKRAACDARTSAGVAGSHTARARHDSEVVYWTLQKSLTTADFKGRYRPLRTAS